MEHDEKFPRVAKGVYSSGKNKDQQEEARKFLEDIGVGEVGEADQVEAILKQRYVKGTINLRKQHHEEDLKRFITLIEDTPSQTNLFKGYFIFELDNEHWGKPCAHVFVDLPYLDTGLRAYYEALGKNSNRKRALSPKYEKYGIKPEKLGKFAEMVGAQIKLEVEEQKISIWHPKYDYLMSAQGERRRNEINTDYTIPAFRVLLDKPNLDKARLIWQTMDSLSSIYLAAKYRKSESGGFRYADSSLVYDLRKAKWVPQEHGESLRFVSPCDASNELLPEDFSHNSRREWIRKVEFGENARKKSEDHIALNRNAREMGFDNEDDAKKWAELKKMGISPDEIRSNFMSSPEFPTSQVSNLERRQAKRAEQFRDSPDKEYKQQQRSVRTTRREIDPRTYLENQYTNDDDQMICQICQEEMPFKKRDGEYYFETKEALSRDYFTKEHEAQYLALCPECAARYEEFVKNDGDTMKKVYDVLKKTDDLKITLQLGELKRSLRFVETHRQDIRTILQNE